MTISLRTLGTLAGLILAELTDRLLLDDAHKSDHGPFTPVQVAGPARSPSRPALQRRDNRSQDDDLVPDPEMTFVSLADGRWVPVSFQTAAIYQSPVRWLEDGGVKVDSRQQSDLVSFANTWMANIAEQQGLSKEGAR